ncbi:MAG: late competence development ComFB family protein [Treponema sp.]|nr:late competence development ComFB family protein [Treponema sp.]
MNVHNLMEDIVNLAVNRLYDQVKNEGANWLSCDCENCRLDTVNYVLNRIPPKYVVSGRGVTHAANDLESPQLKADIEALAMEGMRIVSSTKRPYHTNHPSENQIQADSKPAFNFYTFTGTILDGNTFEPVTNATILLKYDGKVAPMVDKTWPNPYTTAKSTNGTYSFWVKSIPAEAAGITKHFNFALEVTAADYVDLTYHFELPITSEAVARNELDSTYSVKLKDLVIFKK